MGGGLVRKLIWGRGVKVTRVYASQYRGSKVALGGSPVPTYRGKGVEGIRIHSKLGKPTWGACGGWGGGGVVGPEAIRSPARMDVPPPCNRALPVVISTQLTDWLHEESSCWSTLVHGHQQSNTVHS